MKKPPLRAYVGSYAVVEIATGKVVAELFKDSALLDKVNTKKYRLVPMDEHLASLSRKENPMKKPTPAQLAARAKFAAAAKAGTLKRKTTKRKKTVSQKISQLVREGYPQKQAVAVALSEQRAGKVKRNPNALLKPVLRLDGWEVSRYKSMDTAIAEARRRAVSDLEYDKPNPKTHYVTKAGRTMYEVTTQPYGDTVVMQVKPADALKLYELGYTSRDFHEQLRTKRKTNPATGRKGSGTKLNPADEYGYSVEMEGVGKSGLFITKAVFKSAPDAKQYARALAKMHPNRTIRVMSGGKWLKRS